MEDINVNKLMFKSSRSEIKELNEAQTRFKAEAYDSAISPTLSRMEARKLYEDQIRKAKAQQLILYSCSLNESSHDESYGALYLTNLLKDANKFDNCQYYGKRFKVALESHHNAAIRVKADNRDKQNPQNPDYQTTKFLNIEDHLILSINPARNIYR